MLNIFQFLLPSACFVCGEVTDNLICERCLRSVKEIFPGLEFRGECDLCRKVYSVFEYNELMKNLLTGIKFRRDIVTAFNLGRLIGKIVRNGIDFETYNFVVPVPVSKKRLKKRLFHQTFEMVRGMGMEVFMPPIFKIEKVKEIRSQIGLGLEERRTNVKDAFNLPERSPDITGKRILIFDDLFTTGSTAGEIARLLIYVGRVKEVDVLTCCRGKLLQEN